MNLKSFKVLLTALFLAASFGLHAETNKTELESPQTVLSTKYVLDQYELKSFVVSGAITTGSKYDRLFGGTVALDYRLSKRFSIGGQGNFYFQSSDLNGEREYAVALRSNYHFMKMKKFNKNPLDMYFGLSLGTEVFIGDKEVKNPFIAAHVGARYDLNDNWMVFTEVGTRNAALGLAVSF